MISKLTTSKEDCIAKYSEYKRKHDGEVPKFRAFCKFAAIPAKHLVALYGRDAFAKLQEECGDTPNKLQLKRTPRDRIMRQYGDLALEMIARASTSEKGALPNSSDWEHRRLKPTTSGLQKSHGISWTEFPQIFQSWVSAENISGYDRVIELITRSGGAATTHREKRDQTFELLVSAIRQWSPARRRNSEGEYKVELRGHLKALGHNVNEEYGESNFDLLVEKRYAIEIKKDPSLAEYDRLFGQLARHLQHQYRVIAVIFDVPREDTYSTFVALVDAYLNKDRNTVEVIKK
jgi:hypothetical protein